MKQLAQKITDLHEQIQSHIPQEELLISESVEDVKITDLVRPYYSTRKVVSDRLKTLLLSLHEHGFIGGIVISSKNNVIDGWHRVEIWKQMGNSTIPCIRVDVSLAQEKKLHLSLNQQVALFNPKDFAFKSSFEGLNLLEDFGFSKEDLMPEIHPVITAVQRRGAEKSSDDIPRAKIIAMIPKSYSQRMEDLRKQMKLMNKSQVIITLIDFYEKHNCNIQEAC